MRHGETEKTGQAGGKQETTGKTGEAWKTGKTGQGRQRRQGREDKRMHGAGMGGGGKVRRSRGCRENIGSRDGRGGDRGDSKRYTCLSSCLRTRSLNFSGFEIAYLLTVVLTASVVVYVLRFVFADSDPWILRI